MPGPKKYKDQTNKVDDLLDKDFSPSENIFKYKHKDTRNKQFFSEFDYMLKIDPTTRERFTEGKLRYKEYENEIKISGNTNALATARVYKTFDDYTIGGGVDYQPWKEERTAVAEFTYNEKPANCTVTASYGKKKGIDFTGVYKACKCLKLGASLYLDLEKQRLTTYNLLAFLKFEKLRVMLEHKSGKEEAYGFGNLVVRALFNRRHGHDIGFRAVLNRKTQENTFEIGGKGYDRTDVTWRWKVNNFGLITLGAQTQLYDHRERYGDGQKLIASIATEVNAAKRNAFEDDLNFGVMLKYESEQYD